MQSKKSLAVWMDFSIAYLMECTDNEILTVTIEAGNNQLAGKSRSLSDNNVLKISNQEQLSSYYLKIGDFVLHYEDVLFFGPTGSKNELFNLLLLDPRFDRINMSVKDTNKMNDAEREWFVRTNVVRSGHTLSSFRQRESSFVGFEPFGYFTSTV